MLNRKLSIISSVFIVIGVLLLGSCAEKYQLSITGLSGGSVSMTPSDGAYSEGTRVTLTATPNSGYAFTGWGNIAGYSLDNATGRSVEITMPGKSLEVSAGFSIPGKGWLFMLYMAGDNSLSDEVNKDINEIEKGLYDAVAGGNAAIAGDVRVLVLADKSGTADTKLYLAAPDNNSYNLASTVIIDGAYGTSTELNMADPDTLKNFVEYGLAKYPSEHNALVLWNHGGGVKSLDFQTTVSKAILEDKNYDIMYLNEVQTAVSTALAGSKLDIIGMDACIMGEVETAYEMRTVADYFVGSAANELGYGWGYNYIFDNFTTAGSPPSPEVLADILVTQFKESTPSLPHYDPDTMVAVKTSELENLKTQIDKLAELVHVDYYNGGTPVEAVKTAFKNARDASVYYHKYNDPTEIRYIPYYDIYSFCNEIELSSGFTATVKDQAGLVKTALASSIVASYGNSSNFDAYHTDWPNLALDYYETSDSAAVRGLSITIPHGEKDFDYGLTDSPIRSYYYTIWWYGEELHNTSVPGIILGGIDFCTYDNASEGHDAPDGIVETWRELFEAWYDTDGHTPGSY